MATMEMTTKMKGNKMTATALGEAAEMEKQVFDSYGGTNLSAQLCC